MAPDSREEEGRPAGKQFDHFRPRFFRRMALFLVGNFVLAFGVALAAKSNLGTTAINSVAYVPSRIFSIDHGLMTAIIYCVYVLLQIAILRKDFSFFSFLQIGVAVLFGWFVSLNNRILMPFSPGTYPVQALLMLGSVIIIGFGIFLYLKADLIPQPADGLLLAIREKTGWKLHNAKICLDCAMVALAAAISLVAAHRIIGIREGTLVAMVGVGKAFGFFSARLGPKLDNLLKLLPA